MNDDLVTKIKELKQIPNSTYYDLKYKFNYFSNKIEGSTFSLENLLNLMEYNIVDGKHRFDDVIETKNSLKLFDYVIDTLGEKLNKTLLLSYHYILKNNTLDDERGFKGCYKKIPNQILGTNKKFTQPHEVEGKINKLLDWYYSLEKVTLKEIAKFHLDFEMIHPFQDGNGRIGRFIILKQCLENNLNPILIKDQNVIEYSNVMNGNSEDLYKFLCKCQVYKLY
jgi:Fic family protein